VPFAASAVRTHFLRAQDLNISTQGKQQFGGDNRSEVEIDLDSLGNVMAVEVRLRRRRSKVSGENRNEFREHLGTDFYSDGNWVWDESTN
jgi:hypothetical protein